VKNLRRLIFLHLFLFSIKTFACQCPPVEILSIPETRKYDIIFQAQIDSVFACIDVGTTMVSVKEVYKGNLSASTLLYFDCVSSCQIGLNKNDTWLFYAHKLSGDKYEVRLCDRNRKLFSNDEEDYFRFQTGLSYKQEVEFLKQNIGVQSIATDENTEDKKDVTLRENRIGERPMNLMILLFSALGFGIIYWLIKKFFK